MGESGTAVKDDEPDVPAVDAAQQDEFTVLDLLIVLAKHKRMIGALILLVALISTVWALLLPNVYTSSARVLPPQQNQSTAAMMIGQLGGLAGAAGNAFGIKNPGDLYVGMLKSRTVLDAVIRRFDLQNVFETKTMVETRSALEGRTNVTAGKDGIILIEFDDENAERSAAVTNAYVEELQKLTQSLAITEASQRRLFFEGQLKQAKQDLAAAEVALQQTQEKTGLIKLDDQGKAIIEAVALLRGQISATEVELRAMRTFATASNPDYLRVQQQLAGLRSELTKLERANISGEGDILLPTGKVPEAGLEFLRKFRDVKYQETMFELLAKQFEAAKIDEAKEVAIIQVVDRAVVPDRKSKPKRALIVGVAIVVAAFVAGLAAFLFEARNRAKNDPAQAMRLAALHRLIFSR